MLFIIFNLFISFFFITLIGILINRQNILRIFISIEFLFLLIIMLFLFSSFLIDDFLAQGFSLWILTVAATESAIGLALLIAYYRLKGCVSLPYTHVI